VDYDGIDFDVYMNGVKIITKAKVGTPSGNVGFRVKTVTGSAVTGVLSDITVSQ